MRHGVWRIDGRGADAVAGEVVWAPAKSLWNTSMPLLALGLGLGRAGAGRVRRHDATKDGLIGTPQA